MEHSLKTGLSFGLTSGVITTLGLMVGLNASTESKAVVMGGILTIAIADAFSDALGIHISEESENKHTELEIWKATISTFFCKAVFAASFIIPVLLLDLPTAILVSVVYGMILLATFSYYIGRDEEGATWRIISEHISIALVVIVLTHYTGLWIKSVFPC